MERPAYLYNSARYDDNIRDLVYGSVYGSRANDKGATRHST